MVKVIQPHSILSFGELWNNLVLISLIGLKYPVYISDRCKPDKSFGLFQHLLRKWLYPLASGMIAQTEKANEIYQKARERAKEAKKNAILAYLEMKNIKKTYMLDDIDESDNEFDEFASRDSSSEISDTESLENE